ncbi:MAG: TnpV protein [Clostridia bacterium]|nr:TnpV protein [Clostridia bacterium]
MANITYRQVNDFMIPNLTLPPEESPIRLGKWGMLHKDYLQKHKKVVFATLITQGKLYQHCAEVENQAQQMFDDLVAQMMKNENITEHLKEQNQMGWVRRMNSIQDIANEIVSLYVVFV